MKIDDTSNGLREFRRSEQWWYAFIVGIIAFAVVSLFMLYGCIPGAYQVPYERIQYTPYQYQSPVYYPQSLPSRGR